MGEIYKYKYFEFRKISPEMYKNMKVPLWIKNEIKNREWKILDFGCGFGGLIKALIKEGYRNVYGVDIEKTALNYCLNLGLAVKEIKEEFDENPFDFKFDVVIINHVIEHIEKNKIIDFLAKIKEILLAPGGILLVAVPNAMSNTNCYWAYEDFTHTTLFTAGSLYYVLRSAGFENVEFLDIDCTLDCSVYKKLVKKFLLKLYKVNKLFWNKVTGSSYHIGDFPLIFSHEIKCKAY